MRGAALPRARGRRGHGAQSAVQAAVAATAQTRPGVGAHAGEHAAWWARNSVTLFLIADHEKDPARAQAARADAVTSQRLAEAMAAAHTAQADQSVPVPQSSDGYEAGAELPDVSDLDVLEAGL
jgi:hypothetical protein